MKPVPQSKFYTDRIHEKGATAIRGSVKGFHSWEKMAARNNALISAFLADDDIQQITICSTNIGLALTYTKESK